MCDTVVITLATADEVDAIKRICNQHRNLGFVNRAALYESIEKSWLLVAKVDDMVIGFVQFRKRRDGWTTVYHIAVDRDHLGQGAGTLLMRHIPTPRQLKCTTDNPANVFYEKLGFRLDRVEAGRKRPLNVWRQHLTDNV